MVRVAQAKSGVHQPALAAVVVRVVHQQPVREVRVALAADTGVVVAVVVKHQEPQAMAATALKASSSSNICRT